MVPNGGLSLILSGFVAKAGAIIRTILLERHSGGVIPRFGIVVASGSFMLSHVKWNSSNMVIFAMFGLDLQLDPTPV